MDLNQFIKKSHIKAVEKFNLELQEYARYTGECPPILYEDPFTHFTLWNLKVEEGELRYEYDGKPDHDTIVWYDEDEHMFYEDDGMDGIMEGIKFWRRCLKRAKRYWDMDNVVLDRIQDGEQEDNDDD